MSSVSDDDIVFVEEVPPSTSSARKRSSLGATRSSSKNPSVSKAKSSSLIDNWIKQARKDILQDKKYAPKRQVIVSPWKQFVDKTGETPEKKKEETKDEEVLIDDSCEEVGEARPEVVDSKDTVAATTADTTLQLSIEKDNQDDVVMDTLEPTAVVDDVKELKEAGEGPGVSQVKDKDECKTSPVPEIDDAFIQEYMYGSVDDREEKRRKLRDGDVIRKRDDRLAMHGQDCACCSRYYDALGLNEEERRKRIDQVSKHRYVSRPMPRTPPHYWETDFPSEEDQIKRGILSIRYETKKEEDVKKNEVKEEEEKFVAEEDAKIKDRKSKIKDQDSEINDEQDENDEDSANALLAM